MYSFQLALIIVWLLEGVSMGILMVFHFKNFKHGSLLASQDEPSYATVRLSEYHRFTSEEINAVNLAD